MPRVIIIKGADDGRQFDLSEPVYTVGRDSSSQMRLHDTEVSRRHAEFRKTGKTYRLVDMGSANGTFVNNEQIKEVELRQGDHIRIGQSILVFSAGRTELHGVSDLADRISMIARQDDELSSNIVKTIGEAEGSRILSRPDQAGGPWLKGALANLAVMYETIQAVSHILDLDQLLERIMELIFKSIEADRGCIMLRHPTGGQFEPKAIRWREEVGSEEKIALSHTIMDHVLREKQGVLVSDAATDARFNTGQSIVRFGIREVICVPMKGRHETLGVIYLDTRSTAKELMARNNPAGKFTEDHLALAIAIGHQAALAVEETRYHQAMVQAERLAAIGHTIASLSHSIKNILQGLRSGGEILKMGISTKDDELVQRGWKIFERSQGRIYDLVMDMLSYSKEREPCIEEADLNELAQDVFELLDARAKEQGIQFEVRLEAGLPRVQMDSEGIHKAMMNIVANAFDAVEERKQPQVALSTRLDPEAGWVRIEVLDNGLGIPDHKLADIFKPFVSTKGAKGTGLGLAVSRKILREHGGDILVQSLVGKACKFILRLPIKSPLGLEPSQVDSPITEPTDDDNPVMS